MTKSILADGAIISIDSWENSYINFTKTIEVLSMEEVQTSCVSFLGKQAPLVVTNSSIDKLIDVNKNDERKETDMVAQNTMTKERQLKH